MLLKVSVGSAVLFSARWVQCLGGTACEEGRVIRFLVEMAEWNNLWKERRDACGLSLGDYYKRFPSVWQGLKCPRHFAWCLGFELAWKSSFGLMVRGQHHKVALALPQSFLNLSDSKVWVLGSSQNITADAALGALRVRQPHFMSGHICDLFCHFIFFSFSAYILSSFSLISDFISPTTHTRGRTDILCC